jgi:hypothetical protein
MWSDVKNKFHTAYFVIIGLTFLVAPWELSKRGEYDSTVYSLILQPPHLPYPFYTASIDVEKLIGNLIVVSIIFGIVYFSCKKLVYKE